MVGKKEYLVIQYDRNGEIKKELRAPKSANPRLLLERLVCRELDDETLIASCLRKNAKRSYDPFQIIDMRDEYRRDQAREALSENPNSNNPIGIYNSARAKDIPLGTSLMVAGVNHDFFIKEVEAQ